MQEAIAALTSGPEPRPPTPPHPPTPPANLEALIGQVIAQSGSNTPTREQAKQALEGQNFDVVAAIAALNPSPPPDRPGEETMEQKIALIVGMQHEGSPDLKFNADESRAALTAHNGDVDTAVQTLKVNALVNMGFDKAACQKALSDNDWHFQHAYAAVATAPDPNLEALIDQVIAQSGINPPTREQAKRALEGSNYEVAAAIASLNPSPPGPGNDLEQKIAQIVEYENDNSNLKFNADDARAALNAHGGNVNVAIQTLKVNAMVKLGFDEDACRKALSDNKWHFQNAVAVVATADPNPPGPLPGSLEQKVAQLTAMGVKGEVARRALTENGGDLNAALDKLFSKPPPPDNVEDVNRLVAMGCPREIATELMRVHKNNFEDAEKEYKVSRIVSMGFDKGEVVETLRACGMDLQRATLHLTATGGQYKGINGGCKVEKPSPPGPTPPEPSPPEPIAPAPEPELPAPEPTPPAPEPTPPAPEPTPPALQALMDMGFPRDVAARALKSNGNRLDRAADHLMSLGEPLGGEGGGGDQQPQPEPLLPQPAPPPQPLADPPLSTQQDQCALHPQITAPVPWLAALDAQASRAESAMPMSPEETLWKTQCPVYMPPKGRIVYGDYGVSEKIKFQPFTFAKVAATRQVEEQQEETIYAYEKILLGPQNQFPILANMIDQNRKWFVDDADTRLITLPRGERFVAKAPVAGHGDIPDLYTSLIIRPQLVQPSVGGVAAQPQLPYVIRRQIGLPNVDNSCFMNSILQLLASLAPIHVNVCTAPGCADDGSANPQAGGNLVHGPGRGVFNPNGFIPYSNGEKSFDYFLGQVLRVLRYGPEAKAEWDGVNRRWLTQTSPLMKLVPLLKQLREHTDIVPHIDVPNNYELTTRIEREAARLRRMTRQHDAGEYLQAHFNIDVDRPFRHILPLLRFHVRERKRFETENPVTLYGRPGGTPLDPNNYDSTDPCEVLEIPLGRRWLDGYTLNFVGGTGEHKFTRQKFNAIKNRIRAKLQDGSNVFPSLSDLGLFGAGQKANFIRTKLDPNHGGVIPQSDVVETLEIADASKRAVLRPENIQCRTDGFAGKRLISIADDDTIAGEPEDELFQPKPKVNFATDQVEGYVEYAGFEMRFAPPLLEVLRETVFQTYMMNEDEFTPEDCEEFPRTAEKNNCKNPRLILEAPTKYSFFTQL